MSPRGGHTTVIQRILERRAERPPEGEDTTATIAVMMRTLPPPKALLVCRDPILRQQLERRITADTLDSESLDDEFEALRRHGAEFRPVIITDSLEFTRKIRAQRAQRVPFVVYVAERDDTDEREAGLAAGADECVARRASDREIDARLAAARRIAELETVLEDYPNGESQTLRDRRPDSRRESALLQQTVPSRSGARRTLRTPPLARSVRYRPLQEAQRHARARSRRSGPAAIWKALAANPTQRDRLGSTYWR